VSGGLVAPERRAHEAGETDAVGDTVSIQRGELVTVVVVARPRDAAAPGAGSVLLYEETEASALARRLSRERREAARPLRAARAPDQAGAAREHPDAPRQLRPGSAA
jgi:hypothetical protein